MEAMLIYQNISKALFNEFTLNVLSVGIYVADVMKDFLHDPVSWMIGGSIAFVNITRGVKNLVGTFKKDGKPTSKEG